MKSGWKSRIDGCTAATELLQGKVGISEQVMSELFFWRG